MAPRSMLETFLLTLKKMKLAPCVLNTELSTTVFPCRSRHRKDPWICIHHPDWSRSTQCNWFFEWNLFVSSTCCLFLISMFYDYKNKKTNTNSLLFRKILDFVNKFFSISNFRSLFGGLSRLFSVRFSWLFSLCLELQRLYSLCFATFFRLFGIFFRLFGNFIPSNCDLNNCVCSNLITDNLINLSFYQMNKTGLKWPCNY